MIRTSPGLGTRIDGEVLLPVVVDVEVHADGGLPPDAIESGTASLWAAPGLIHAGTDESAGLPWYDRQRAGGYRVMSDVDTGRVPGSWSAVQAARLTGSTFRALLLPLREGAIEMTAKFTRADGSEVWAGGFGQNLKLEAAPLRAPGISLYRRRRRRHQGQDERGSPGMRHVSSDGGSSGWFRADASSGIESDTTCWTPTGSDAGSDAPNRRPARARPLSRLGSRFLARFRYLFESVSRSLAMRSLAAANRASSDSRHSRHGAAAAAPSTPATRVGRHARAPTIDFSPRAAMAKAGPVTDSALAYALALLGAELEMNQTPAAVTRAVLSACVGFPLFAEDLHCEGKHGAHSPGASAAFATTSGGTVPFLASRSNVARILRVWLTPAQEARAMQALLAAPVPLPPGARALADSSSSTSSSSSSHALSGASRTPCPSSHDGRAASASSATGQRQSLPWTPTNANEAAGSGRRQLSLAAAADYALLALLALAMGQPYGAIAGDDEAGAADAGGGGDSLGRAAAARRSSAILMLRRAARRGGIPLKCEASDSDDQAQDRPGRSPAGRAGHVDPFGVPTSRGHATSASYASLASLGGAASSDPAEAHAGALLDLALSLMPGLSGEDADPPAPPSSDSSTRPPFQLSTDSRDGQAGFASSTGPHASAPRMTVCGAGSAAESSGGRSAATDDAGCHAPMPADQGCTGGGGGGGGGSGSVPGSVSSLSGPAAASALDGLCGTSLLARDGSLASLTAAVPASSGSQPPPPQGVAAGSTGSADTPTAHPTAAPVRQRSGASHDAPSGGHALPAAVSLAAVAKLLPRRDAVADRAATFVDDCRARMVANVANALVKRVRVTSLSVSYAISAEARIPLQLLRSEGAPSSLELEDVDAAEAEDSIDDALAVAAHANVLGSAAAQLANRAGAGRIAGGAAVDDEESVSRTPFSGAGGAAAAAPSPASPVGLPSPGADTGGARDEDEDPHGLLAMALAPPKSARAVPFSAQPARAATVTALDPAMRVRLGANSRGPNSPEGEVTLDSPKLSPPSPGARRLVRAASDVSAAGSQTRSSPPFDTVSTAHTGSFDALSSMASGGARPSRWGAAAASTGAMAAPATPGRAGPPSGLQHAHSDHHPVVSTGGSGSALAFSPSDSGDSDCDAADDDDDDGGDNDGGSGGGGGSSRPDSRRRRWRHPLTANEVAAAAAAATQAARAGGWQSPYRRSRLETCALSAVGGRGGTIDEETGVMVKPFSGAASGSLKTLLDVAERAVTRFSGSDASCARYFVDLVLRRWPRMDSARAVLLLKFVVAATAAWQPHSGDEVTPASIVAAGPQPARPASAEDAAMEALLRRGHLSSHDSALARRAAAAAAAASLAARRRRPREFLAMGRQAAGMPQAGDLDSAPATPSIRVPEAALATEPSRPSDEIDEGVFSAARLALMGSRDELRAALVRRVCACLRSPHGQLSTTAAGLCHPFPAASAPPSPFVSVLITSRPCALAIIEALSSPSVAQHWNSTVTKNAKTVSRGIAALALRSGLAARHDIAAAVRRASSAPGAASLGPLQHVGSPTVVTSEPPRGVPAASTSSVTPTSSDHLTRGSTMSVHGPASSPQSRAEAAAEPADA
ncbi:hypothetical protein FNF28_05715 [Cafeteria roenbergensis]|uniref:Uncharacterized protein n=1 Tax=Cafeteria roenbergensis TaxID=33653 RepID=A0A5A8D2R0_CAFRO|nr:hypothetical protein FNF28_05715 [Cafeteria roenbergensis]